jgi:hypothetical protein
MQGMTSDDERIVKLMEALDHMSAQIGVGMSPMVQAFEALSRSMRDATKGFARLGSALDELEPYLEKDVEPEPVVVLNTVLDTGDRQIDLD